LTILSYRELPENRTGSGVLAPQSARKPTDHPRLKSGERQAQPLHTKLAHSLHFKRLLEKEIYGLFFLQS
jgi:hypothetical protein